VKLSVSTSFGALRGITVFSRKPTTGVRVREALIFHFSHKTGLVLAAKSFSLTINPFKARMTGLDCDGLRGEEGF
jgi:hypothetical protein